MNEPLTAGKSGFTIIEDDGVNMTIEVSEKHHQADLAGGLNDDEKVKLGR